MLELKAGPMREHDYSTLFKLEHMLKDVRLCLEAGAGGGRALPRGRGGARGARRRGGPRPRHEDFAAVLEVSRPAPAFVCDAGPVRRRV